LLRLHSTLNRRVGDGLAQDRVHRSGRRRRRPLLRSEGTSL